jgi:predicted  nucleic acid-binding Zn-ribbon protein
MSQDKLQEAEKAFLDALLARKEALLEEVREADKEGDRRYGRIRDLREERDGLGERISALEAERTGTPMEAYRAGLDEDYKREDSLKLRYKAAGEELSQARDRSREVEAELSGLLTSHQGHENDGVISAFRESVGAARAARTELEELKQRVVKALDEHLKPVAEQHESAKGQMWAWNTERTNALAEKAAFGKTNAEAMRQSQEGQERARLRKKSPA